MIVVSDTSPIGNLIQIQQLDLLRVIFTELIIPPEVDKEIRALGKFGIDMTDYTSCNWIKIVSPTNYKKVAYLINKSGLDKGESEAIVLARELNADWLLMDERLGTNKAISEGLKTIGLLGILLKAKQLQLIPAIKPVLNDLVTIAGFWISEKLMQRVLTIANEN